MSQSVWKEALDSRDDSFLKTDDLKVIAEKRGKQSINSFADMLADYVDIGVNDV